MQPLILSNIDYIYVVALIVIGLILVTSPRSFMKKVAITEDSIKAEGILKYVGFGIILTALIVGGIIFFQ